MANDGPCTSAPPATDIAADRGDAAAAPGPSVARVLHEVWAYRGFVRGMVAREFRARYLHSLLGTLWAILNPLALIVIYTVIFSRVMQARLPGVNDALAYALYLCAGLLPWTAFAELLMRCQTVFLEHADLLKKVSFPRASLPVILLATTTINFAIIYSLFTLFLVTSHRFPGAVLLAVVPLFVLQQAFAIGLGILLGTLNVFYRDVAQVVGVCLQFWFWFTPIVYTVTILPDRTRRLFALNPMTQLAGAYQQVVLRGQWPQWGVLRIHLMGAVIALAAGIFAFYKLGGEIVDEL